MTESRTPMPTPGDAAVGDDDDDVVGHRFLTPEQAQQRAERARADREQPHHDEPQQPATQ